MAKVIRGFNIDLSSIQAVGAVREFQVIGDNGAIFSLEITNKDNYYYNFKTKTFTATYKRLKNKRVDSGIYNGSIVFPAITVNDQYNIFLYAESNHDTSHFEYSEVRFGDDSLDINSSTGSSSNLLKKVIYQYTDTTVTLSAISPSATHHTTGNFQSMAVTTDTIVTGRGKSVGKTPFTIVVTAATTKALQIDRQPTIDDLSAFTSVTMGSGVKISGEDVWTGSARNTDTVNGAVETSSRLVMDTAVASKMKVGDRVTGTGISSSATVVVAALDPDDDNVYEFSMIDYASGAAIEVTVGDGVTLTFTPPYYYRWSINSSSSIHKLIPGMTAVDPDQPTITAKIGPYKDTTTYTTEVQNEDGSINEIENIVTNVSVEALDPLGSKPTIVNGLVTQQLGYITFTSQITNDLAADACVFYAYGPSAIKAIANTVIKLSDLKVELTAPTTTTTEATTAHATIAVADREGVVNNVSTVSGVGIDSSVANPTLTTGGGLDGAGDWIMSAVQSLENGITLTVGGTGRTVTITGNIEFENVDETNFTLYFDLEKFLTAT